MSAECVSVLVLPRVVTYSAAKTLINNEIEEISHKIEALDAIRSKLEHDLLKLQEEELELDDECTSSFAVATVSLPQQFTVEGVRERLELEESTHSRNLAHSVHLPHTSRRRKGPAFLPSEHDELPPGVAFMVSRILLFFRDQS